MVGSGVGPFVNNFGRPVQPPGMYPMNGAYQMNQMGIMNNLNNQSMMMNTNMTPAFNNINNPGNQIYPTQVTPGPPTYDNADKVTTAKSTNTKNEEKSNDKK
jgi:hypothetical protein